ncbi:MAG: hypothetical protein AAFN30_11740 [Actinomycetota bacterium]
MKRFVNLLTIVATAALVLSAPAAAQTSGPGDLEVSIMPEVVDVTLGESVEITVSITNHGPTPTDELVAHIDITDPTRSGSVDPEDWTATLSRGVGIIQPGSTSTAAWNLHPISGGRFSVYAVTLSPNNAAVHATAQAIDFNVEHQRTLNPQGVLPIAVTMPLLIGALLVVQWRLSRSRQPERQTQALSSTRS